MLNTNLFLKGRLNALVTAQLHCSVDKVKVWKLTVEPFQLDVESCNLLVCNLQIECCLERATATLQFIRQYICKVSLLHDRLTMSASIMAPSLRGIRSILTGGWEGGKKELGLVVLPSMTT